MTHRLTAEQIADILKRAKPTRIHRMKDDEPVKPIMVRRPAPEAPTIAPKHSGKAKVAARRLNRPTEAQEQGAVANAQEAREKKKENHRKDADSSWKWSKKRKKRLDEGLCAECGENKRQNRISPFCIQCAGKRRQYQSKRHKVFVAHGFCTLCRQKNDRPNKCLCSTCSIAHIEQARQRRKKMKTMIFEFFGNKCKGCGETDLRVLTLDHINNDGAQHRKKRSQKRGTGAGYRQIYREMLLEEKMPELQILCFNCHAKKDLTPWWLREE